MLRSYENPSTIVLDNDLEGQTDQLSQQERQEETVVILEVLRHELSEKQRREDVAKALEEVFARPVPEPFDTMTEAEVMQVVEEKITAQRAEDRSSRKGLESLSTAMSSSRPD